MTQTAFEQALTESLPDGFVNTFIEASRLRRLRSQSTSNLNNTVAEYDSFTLTESDVIENTAQRMLTSFLTPERTIEFAGFALSLYAGLLTKWAARYKEDNDTPSGTVTNPERAEVDDIVFTPITPEVFVQITDDDTLSPNYVASGLTAGDRLDVIGDMGHDTSQNSADAALSLAPDEQIFLTGDFVDLTQGQSVVTATEYPNIDGNDFGPTNVMFQSRLSGAHIMTTQGTYCTDEVDLDAKVYDDGDAEVRPIGFYLGPGRKAPELV
jgi:hypothetical protein